MKRTGPDQSRVLRPGGSVLPVPDDMKQNFLVLEDSVDVDALVSRIEGVLRIHNTPAGHRSGSASAGPAHKTHKTPSCCLRLRNQRNQRGGPYQLPCDQDQDWDQVRWTRKRVRTEQDPERLLQDLVLSGNLIKEAVRRLQFSQLDWTRTQDLARGGPDNVPCS